MNSNKYKIPKNKYTSKIPPSIKSSNHISPISNPSYNLYKKSHNNIIPNFLDFSIKNKKSSIIKSKITTKKIKILHKPSHLKIHPLSANSNSPSKKSPHSQASNNSTISNKHNYNGILSPPLIPSNHATNSYNSTSPEITSKTSTPSITSPGSDYSIFNTTNSSNSNHNANHSKHSLPPITK